LAVVVNSVAQYVLDRALCVLAHLHIATDFPPPPGTFPCEDIAFVNPSSPPRTPFFFPSVRCGFFRFFPFVFSIVFHFPVPPLFGTPSLFYVFFHSFYKGPTRVPHFLYHIPRIKPLPRFFCLMTCSACGDIGLLLKVPSQAAVPPLPRPTPLSAFFYRPNVSGYGEGSYPFTPLERRLAHGNSQILSDSSLIPCPSRLFVRLPHFRLFYFGDLELLPIDRPPGEMPVAGGNLSAHAQHLGV